MKSHFAWQPNTEKYGILQMKTIKEPMFLPKNVGYLSNSRKSQQKIWFLNDSDLEKKVSHLLDLHSMDNRYLSRPCIRGHSSFCLFL